MGPYPYLIEDDHLELTIVTTITKKNPIILYRDQFSASERIARFQGRKHNHTCYCKVKIGDIKMEK